MFHMKTAKQNIFLHIKIKKLLEELQELFNIYLTIKPAKKRLRFSRFDSINDQEVANALFNAVETTQKKREWKLSMARLDLTI